MQQNPSVEPVLRSIDAAEAHVRSEYVHDLEGTMATVGPSPHYAVTASPGVISVISGREGVAALYAGAHDYAIPDASRFLTQISGDWFLFVENAPTRKWVADGSMRTAHTATLLITGDDGVRGEFVWERPPFEPETPNALPLGAVRGVAAHEAFLAALRDGDAPALRALLDPDCSWAERDYVNDAPGAAILELSGSDAVIGYCEQWREAYRPELVSILNRQATDWYVFAEELWIVRTANGERRQYRKAVIYPIDAAGRIRGAIGFGTDAEAPSPSSGRCVGQAFWPAGKADAGGRTRVPKPI